MSSRVSEDKLKSAIAGSGGIISTIAKRLKCDWHSASKWIKESETALQAYNNEKETVLDIAEGVLYESISKNKNTQDAKWLLATKGRHRGFGEKLELEQTVNLIIDKDDAEL